MSTLPDCMAPDGAEPCKGYLELQASIKLLKVKIERSAAMKTEEGMLKDQVKAHLAKLGAYYFMPVPTGYGATTLDFLVCLNGKFLAIETKAKGKRPTKRQELVGQQIMQAGGTVFWCDSFEGYLLNMAAFGFIVEK